MDDSVVTVGLKGSRVAPVATGGNSPLAEMRKSHCTYETVTWFLIRTIDVYWKRCPPHSFHSCTVGSNVHSCDAPRVGPRSLSHSSAHYQMGLSGLCLSVNAVSQHPATPCTELSTPRRLCCGSRPQRQRCLISFPMRGKAAFAQPATTPTTTSWIIFAGSGDKRSPGCEPHVE